MSAERLPLVEHQPHREQLLKSVVTPLTARFLFDAYETAPHAATDAQLFKLRHRTEHDLSYQTAEALLLVGRGQQGTAGSYTERLARSNHKLHTWIHHPDKQSPEKQAALASLGINHDNQETIQPSLRRVIGEDEKQISETIELFEEAERFRARFFGNRGEKNDLKGFVQAIADGCRPSPDEPVDIALLTKRLDAVQEIFPLFGKKSLVDSLVKQHVLSYALLSQKGQAREQMITRATAAFAEEVIDPREQELLPIFIKIQQKENREQTLQQKIAKAQQEALQTKTLERKQEQEDFLYQQFLTGVITQEQFHNALAQIAETTQGLLFFSSYDEFEKALALLHISNSQEILEHEQAHAQKADEYNLAPRYTLRVSKNDDGTYLYHPATLYNHPIGRTPEEVKTIYREILSAPEQLSDHDKRALGEITPQT